IRPDGVGPYRRVARLLCGILLGCHALRGEGCGAGVVSRGDRRFFVYGHAIAPPQPPRRFGYTAGTDCRDRLSLPAADRGSTAQTGVDRGRNTLYANLVVDLADAPRPGDANPSGESDVWSAGSCRD